jgi:HPt (histidine-containing phosphotransfer) domain-containing protein
MTDLPLLDRAVLDELFEYIGADAAQSIIEMFLGESRDFVARISAATPDAAGRDMARRAAHSLKSSAGQLGAVALAAAAERVEHTVEQGKSDLSELAEALRKCASETEVALTDLLHGDVLRGRG